MFIAVLGMQQDRIDAQLHRTFIPWRRGRKFWHRSRNQHTVSDSIYEHLQGRVDEVLCRITRRLRTNCPFISISPLTFDSGQFCMLARIASRSFVVAPLIHTQPRNRAAMFSKRFVCPRERRWPVAGLPTWNQAEPLPCRRICSSPSFPERVDLFLFRTKDCTGTSDGMHADNAVRRPPRDTGTRSPPCRSPGSELFFISKRLGSGTIGRPSAAFDCFDAAYSAVRTMLLALCPLHAGNAKLDANG
jgi:hypothetical protein